MRTLVTVYDVTDKQNHVRLRNASSAFGFRTEMLCGRTTSPASVYMTRGKGLCFRCLVLSKGAPDAD